MSTYLVITALLIAALLPVAAASEWNLAMGKAEAARQEGRVTEAMSAYAEAARISGLSDNPNYERALAKGRQASLLHDLQRHKEAEKAYREALSTLKVSIPSGASRAYTVTLKIDLAALYLELEQPSKALALGIKELIPVIESTQGEAKAYSILGAISFAQQRPSSATEWWRKALSAAEAANLHEDVVVLLSNLGLATYQMNDLPTSSVYLQRAVDMLAATYGLDHPMAVRAQANLAQVLHRYGRHEEALQHLGRAHSSAERWYGRQNVTTAHLAIQYAELLSKSGRAREAKLLLDGVQSLPASIRTGLVGVNTVDIRALGGRSRE